MIITRGCDYGIRIIRALGGGEKKTAEEICAAEHIPSQFAYKILRKLERAGFLKSSRGRDGGYLLIRSLDTFSVFDVVSAVDDNLHINACLKHDAVCSRNKESAPCAVHRELNRIQNAFIEELKSKSILDIVTGT